MPRIECRSIPNHSNAQSRLLTPSSSPESPPVWHTSPKKLTVDSPKTRPSSPSPLTPPASTRTSFDATRQDEEAIRQRLMNFWESGFDTKPMSIGKITQEMYEKLRKTIPERHTFYLNVTTNTLTATPMPSPQHEAILDVITRMRGTLDDWLSTVSPGYSIIVFGAPRLPLFDNTGLHILGKEPDISIGLQHSDDHIMDEIARWGYPPIVVEIGYTETHNQLVNDARDWLLFSAGKILSVIVFKLTKPVGEEDSLDPLKWGLFAELYERDHHNNVVRYGDRIKILPRPDVPPTLKLLPRHILPTTAPIISNIEFECAIHQSALTRSMKLAIAWARRYAEARADGGAGES